jgi:hypothetical protein
VIELAGPVPVTAIVVRLIVGSTVVVVVGGTVVVMVGGTVVVVVGGSVVLVVGRSVVVVAANLAGVELQAEIAKAQTTARPTPRSAVPFVICRLSGGGHVRAPHQCSLE